MKCCVLFVLVALAAVAMAQQDRSFNQQTGNADVEIPSESGEVKRDKRGYLAYSAPHYYSGGYNSYSRGYIGYSRGYNTHATYYSVPYGYRSYPHNGYRSYY